MTEDEAKTKKCPMWSVGGGVYARLMGPQGPAGLTVNIVIPDCMGSRCMMWRWHPKMINVSPTNSVDILRPTGEKPDSGYCGLAGKL